MDADWRVRLEEEIDKVDDLNFLPSDLARSIPWQWVAVGVGKNNHKVLDHKSILLLIDEMQRLGFFCKGFFPIVFEKNIKLIRVLGISNSFRISR